METFSIKCRIYRSGPSFLKLYFLSKLGPEGGGGLKSRAVFGKEFFVEIFSRIRAFTGYTLMMTRHLSRLTESFRVAQDACTDDMLVSASDGSKSVDGTHGVNNSEHSVLVCNNFILFPVVSSGDR